ncbi:adenylyl-sulfate kinase [Halomicrobium sp. IBSBa]|uniref:adenylyl-sulfate kinase n=1 Tax=Halomicrobium sp. IBSBa TaxID=2778916 RepID=UPI001ABF2786|nr:adenylyl-sulfate kinase [Halomicrobium sp. IBSBa]MBO4248888.1 adenylyl-sulfate kinase [Halomicrobium sp. IBSBa]
MTFTIWFMGRPASGKSTLAKRVDNYLRDESVPIENLDGDEIRQNLHPDLGFTREDRSLNNRRTAFICNLLNRNGIAVVNAMITPFRDSQQTAREIVEQSGDFVLIYVKCSVDECEKRDPKGLYEQARNGKIENFTGINHPFEEPHNPDIVVDTEAETPKESFEHVREEIHERGLLETTMAREYNFDLSHSDEQAIKERLQDLGYIN